MTGARWLGLVALLALALLAGCGGGDTTTVINETTTTVAADTSSTSSTTPADDDSDDDDSDDDGGPVLSLKAFQSPSGNIACVMASKYVRCDITDRTWSPPAAPADCQVDYGQGIQLPADGPATFVCAGDTVLNPQAPVLEYGSSSNVGSITCHSDEAEIECESESGGAFSLSREEYDLN